MVKQVAVSSATRTAHKWFASGQLLTIQSIICCCPKLPAALHACAISSCCKLTSCAHQQVQAQAAQKDAAAAQEIATRAKEEAASLQSSLQESRDRIIAQQGKTSRLEAEVESLQRQLQVDQVVMTVTAYTVHTYGVQAAQVLSPKCVLVFGPTGQRSVRMAEVVMLSWWVMSQQ